MKVSIVKNCLLCLLAILFSLTLFFGCSADNSGAENSSSNRSAAITFQLEFTQPARREVGLADARGIGTPDICIDYRIDKITVQVYLTENDTEVNSAEENCVEHSLIVGDLPSDKNLYVVLKGIVGEDALWQAKVNDVTAVANQTTDIGTIKMDYQGDDTSNPVIASTYPPDGATGVDLKTTVAVVFNEALAPGSISNDAISVTHNDAPVQGQASYDPTTRTIRFIPADDTSYDSETVYAARLKSIGDGDNPITDTAGLPLTGDISWQFTTSGPVDTKRPDIIATSPADGAAGVNQHSAISVLFSEPMDPTSFIDRVYQISSPEGTVSGEMVYDEPSRTLTIVPDNQLDANVLYTASITVDARDLVQNHLKQPYTWRFSTGESAGYSYTITTSTIPTNGSGGIITPAFARVPHGEDIALDIQPQGYHFLSQLIVDGVQTTPVSPYLFKNVAANHKIQAVFESINFISHWAFDNDASDVLGVNNGVLDGGHYVAGISNQAISFDGVDDFVDVAMNPNLSLRSFTLSAWVKIPDAIQGGWGVIVEHDRYGDNWYGLYKCTQKDTFHFRWAKTGLAKTDFNTTIYPNTWYHVVGTFNDGTAKIYLNGQLDKTVTEATVGTPNDAGLRIGRNQHDAEAFKAVIDDVRIYDAALSEQDIQEIYNSP